MPGCEVKIASDGEILIRGPNVMKGYYNAPEATREVLEPDGWFHSGDIGEIDPAGFVRITDRKKDIIVTAGGKNVAPQNLENSLKTFPIISQAMVYGDKRKYLSVLITVNEESRAEAPHRTKGVTPPADYAEVAARPEIVAAVQKVARHAELARAALQPAQAVPRDGPRLHPGVRRAHADAEGEAEGLHPAVPGHPRRLYDGEKVVD